MKSGLRIQSGDFKNRVIPLPKRHHQHQNATPSRIKESVFQLVRNELQNESDFEFFDLFAGSGQMGIEALSLGAYRVCFSEIDPHRLTQIRMTCNDLEIPADQVTLTKSKGLKIFQESFGVTESLQIFFADPPYTYHHKPSNDPALLIQSFLALSHEVPVHNVYLIIQAHEKNQILSDDFAQTIPEMKRYAYGSNHLVTLRSQRTNS